MEGLTAKSAVFEKSIKPQAIEEFLDYYFYRRVAHFLVPLFARLGASPNQVTTLSLAAGLLASYFVLNLHFTAGGLLALLAIVLDCCDGQLARITGKSSPMGRIMDGFSDTVWVTTFWFAIYFSGYFQTRGFHVLWLMIPASLSVFLHCWRFDGVKIGYLELADPAFSEKDIDFSEAVAICKKDFRRFHFFSAFLAVCIAFQVYFFVRGTKAKKQIFFSADERLAIKAKLEPVINCWSWLGEGHHNTLVILGVFFIPLTPHVLICAFAIILVPANIWFAYCELKWRGSIKKSCFKVRLFSWPVKKKIHKEKK